MEFLEQGTGTENAPHTDEDVRDSSSLPSSDGSDVTIRQNSKFRMPSSENNYDKEASLEEQLRRLKNSRSGSLSAVTAKKNEINTLLIEDVDVKLVKEKYESLKRLFDKYFYAHRAYQCKLPNSKAIKQAEEQYEEQEISYRNFTEKITEWIYTKDSRSDNISPNDSASQVASKVSSWRQSACSSVTSNEATRMAELMVQAKSLEAQQRLEQEKLRLQQEETRVMLEMEIAKTAVKEKALAGPTSITTAYVQYT